MGAFPRRLLALALGLALGLPAAVRGQHDHDHDHDHGDHDDHSMHGDASGPAAAGMLTTVGGVDKPCYMYMEGNMDTALCMLSGPWLGSQVGAPSHFGKCTSLGKLTAESDKGWSCDVTDLKDDAACDDQMIVQVTDSHAHQTVACMPAELEGEDSSVHQAWWDLYSTFRACMMAHGEHVATWEEPAPTPGHEDHDHDHDEHDHADHACIYEATDVQLEELKITMGVELDPTALEMVSAMVDQCADAETQAACDAVEMEPAAVEELQGLVKSGQTRFPRWAYGVIAAGVGAIFLFALVLVLCCCCCRRKGKE